MKKITIAFIILLIAFSANAQYKTFVFGKLEYKTECHYNKNNFVTITLNLQSLDSYPVQLIIGTQKEYDSFMKRLNLFKIKMIEWDSVCVKNGIEKIDKLIEYEVEKKEKPSIWFGKYYNSCTPLNAYARENGVSKILLHTGSISSLTNDYIKCKGGVLIFNSLQDIDEMINAFDLVNIQKYINDKNKNTELLQ